MSAYKEFVFRFETVFEGNYIWMSGQVIHLNLVTYVLALDVGELLFVNNLNRNLTFRLLAHSVYNERACASSSNYLFFLMMELEWLLIIIKRYNTLIILITTTWLAVDVHSHVTALGLCKNGVAELIVVFDIIISGGLL